MLMLVVLACSQRLGIKGSAAAIVANEVVFFAGFQQGLLANAQWNAFSAHSLVSENPKEIEIRAKD